MKTNNEILAGLVKKARLSSGLTQQQVAEKSNVGFRSYQRIENAELSPKLETLVKITKTLGVEFLVNYTKYLEDNDQSSCDYPHDSRFSEWINESSELPLAIKSDEVEEVKRLFIGNVDDSLKSVGYWEWNVSTSKFFWSEEMYNVYGMAVKADFSTEEFQKKLNKKDVESIENDMNALISQGVPYLNIHHVKINENLVKIKAEARRYKNNADELIVFGIARQLS